MITLIRKDSNMQPQVGKRYLFLTVTDYWLGEVVEVGPFSVYLKDASLVRDTGRLHQFIANGRTDNMEIEPVGEVCCNWLSYIPWRHNLFHEAI